MQQSFCPPRCHRRIWGRNERFAASVLAERGGVEVMDGTECMRDKMKQHTTVMQLGGSEK